MIEAAERLSTATFQQIVAQNESRSEWARLLWEDLTGRVFLITAWGSWSYRWAHIGSKTLAEFMAGLDVQYAGRKFVGESLYEYSRESTIQAIRETILDDRRSGILSKDQAADEWRKAARLEDGFYIDFREWCEASEMQDAYECHRKEMAGSWLGFWERLWVPEIVPVLKAAG